MWKLGNSGSSRSPRPGIAPIGADDLLRIQREIVAVVVDQVGEPLGGLITWLLGLGPLAVRPARVIVLGLEDFRPRCFMPTPAVEGQTSRSQVSACHFAARAPVEARGAVRQGSTARRRRAAPGSRSGWTPDDCPRPARLGMDLACPPVDSRLGRCPEDPRTTRYRHLAGRSREARWEGSERPAPYACLVIGAPSLRCQGDGASW